VSTKQKDKARIVFDRSAQQAGFFPGGKNDRLVMPIVGDLPPITEERRSSDGEEAIDVAVKALSPAHATPTRHPLIEGLFQELPDPKTPWPINQQVNWLEAAAKIFSMLYKSEQNDNGEIKVEISINFSNAE
jgi:hypothetical protein